MTGGQLGPSTLSGLEQLLLALSDSAQIVLWKNAHFGPVDEDGLDALLGVNGAEVVGPVHLERWSKPFEDDVQDMLRSFLSFEEAVRSPALGLMTRQRLAMVQRRVYGEIEYALRELCDGGRDAE